MLSTDATVSVSDHDALATLLAVLGGGGASGDVELAVGTSRVRLGCGEAAAVHVVREGVAHEVVSVQLSHSVRHAGGDEATHLVTVALRAKGTAALVLGCALPQPALALRLAHLEAPASCPLLAPGDFASLVAALRAARVTVAEAPEVARVGFDALAGDDAHLREIYLHGERGALARVFGALLGLVGVLFVLTAMLNMAVTMKYAREGSVGAREEVALWLLGLGVGLALLRVLQRAINATRDVRVDAYGIVTYSGFFPVRGAWGEIRDCREDAARGVLELDLGMGFRTAVSLERLRAPGAAALLRSLLVDPALRPGGRHDPRLRALLVQHGERRPRVRQPLALGLFVAGVVGWLMKTPW